MVKTVTGPGDTVLVSRYKKGISMAGFLACLAWFYPVCSGYLVGDFGVLPERIGTIHAGSPYPRQMFDSRHINNLTELIFVSFRAAGVPGCIEAAVGRPGINRLAGRSP